MRMKVMAATATAVTAVGLGLTAAAPASAGNISCTRASGHYQEYVTSNSTNYYVSAPNKVTAGTSHPELKAFPGNNPNSTASWIRCNASGNRVAFEYVYNGVTYVLENDHGSKNRIDMEVVPSGGPYASEFWVQSGSNPYTFKNDSSGLYMRVSDQGVGQYFPVVTGANASQWTQSAS